MSTLSSQNIAPYLDYGAVIKAWYRGFGFLNGCRSPREVFFHFSTIHEKYVIELLERSVSSNDTDGSPFFNKDIRTEFPDLDLSSRRLWLWFTVEKNVRDQGPLRFGQASKKSLMIFSMLHFNASIDRLIHAISERGLEPEPNLFAQLSRDRRISDERLTPILYSTGFRNHCFEAVGVVRKSQIELYKSLIEWKKIYTTSEVLPRGFEQAAQKLLSPQEIEALLSQRKLSENQWAAEKLNTYGREKCTRCGTYSVYSNGSNRTCTNCGATWYVNHCWNCRRHSSIDSRDPDVHQCNICGWYICASCGACSPNCKRSRG